MAVGYVGRLAPSPTGALHLGNVRTFMIAWLRARSQGGKVIMRMEDLDHPKDKVGADVQAIEDLRWLGFDWDEEYVQSQRKDVYAKATARLHDAGLIYPCICSRKDVEAAQSAPHEGEQLYYPGICRGRFATWADAFHHSSPRLPCWRFRVPENTLVDFTDEFAGPYHQDVSRALGDFPVARDEGGAGYTLAAIVDDVLMGVTEIVRGDDLLPATPPQILLARALFPDRELPRFCHVPLVVGPDGRRLAKRHGDTRISFYRESGLTPERILGYLAASCGWCASGSSRTLASLLPDFSLSTIPNAPFLIGCLLK